MNYYNEFDAKTAEWLKKLVKYKLIPNGDVDTRSIIEIKPDELKHYTQCHFFAGIGGWSLALQLAGWPADRPVWTGSCPCQPFSTAGKGLAQADERHLWPAFFNLIRQCRPEFVFGEQVASAIGKGWLDGVSSDLESEDYACGASVLGAHSVGAPHIRQRLYWLAYTRHLPRWNRSIADESQFDEASGCGKSMDNTKCSGSQGFSQRRSSDSSNGEGWRIGESTPASSWNESVLVTCRDGKTRRIPTEPAFFPLAHGVPSRVVRLRGYGNAIVPQVAAEFIKAYCEVKESEKDFC